jgi:hypothetical protein
MSTLPLSSIKKNYGITDDLQIKFEKKDDELILHIPLRTSYRENTEIINRAKTLINKRKQNSWTRDDFFADFMKVRDKVLNQVKDYYGKK